MKKSYSDRLLEARQCRTVSIGELIARIKPQGLCAASTVSTASETSETHATPDPSKTETDPSPAAVREPLTREEKPLTREEEQEHIRRELDRLHREEERSERELLREHLAPYAISLAGDLPEPKPVIARCDGAIIASEGNLSAVVGEAKSRKSFLCTAIVGDLLNIGQAAQNGFRSRMGHVVWIDTEQSALHVRKVARRLSELTGWNNPDQVHPMIHIYALREEPPKQRFEIVRQAIAAWSPRLVVLDGVADLQHNTNDLEESERLITELMALSSIHHCHILSVLHTNPNSDKARGHLGSSLQRKAETVLYVHKSGEKSLVEPQFCRNEPFERFAFAIDNERFELGIPQPAELPSEEETQPVNRVVELLRNSYGGVSEREVVVKRLMNEGLNPTHIRVLIHRAVKRGLLTLDADQKRLRVTA